MKILIYFVLFLWVSGSHAAPKIATSDWTIAETLTAMGIVPMGVGDKRAYQIWVNSPALPVQTRDMGLRFQPNLEQLQQLKPDVFIQSNWFTHLKPQFERIAPVHEINFATPQGIDYAHTVATTRQLGKLVQASSQAEKLIEQTQKQFQQQKQMLQAYRHRPVAVIQFVDARQARIYGKTSLFHAVLQQLGLQNAWQGDSNAWGFHNISLRELAKLPDDTLLIVVKPHPQSLENTLMRSALWQRLPFVQAANRHVLSPTWSYGALPAMQQFANQLAQHIPQTHFNEQW